MQEIQGQLYKARFVLTRCKQVSTAARNLFEFSILFLLSKPQAPNFERLTLKLRAQKEPLNSTPKTPRILNFPVNDSSWARMSLRYRPTIRSSSFAWVQEYRTLGSVNKSFKAQDCYKKEMRTSGTGIRIVRFKFGFLDV